jgi:hypothetical protein
MALASVGSALFWLKPPKAKLLLHANLLLLGSTPGASFGCLWSFLWQPTSWRQGCAVVLGYPPIGVLESQTCSLELSAAYFQSVSSIFLS